MYKKFITLFLITLFLINQNSTLINYAPLKNVPKHTYQISYTDQLPPASFFKKNKQDLKLQLEQQSSQGGIQAQKAKELLALWLAYEKGAITVEPAGAKERIVLPHKKAAKKTALKVAGTKFTTKVLRRIVGNKIRSALRFIIDKTPEGFPSKALYWLLFTVKELRNLSKNAREATETTIKRFLFLSEDFIKKIEGKKVIWINATGVGEWNLVAPLVTRLKEQYPNHQFVFSSPAGKGGVDYAQSLFPSDIVLYTPHDSPDIFLKRFFKRVNIELFVMAETTGLTGDNFLKEVKNHRGKTVIYNGILTYNSTPMTVLQEKAFRALHDIDLFVMQDQRKAETIASRANPKARIVVSGNIKFDTSVVAVSREEKEKMRELLGAKPETPIILAGSIHLGEIDIIARAFQAIKKNNPEAVLVVAPRRLEDTAKMFTPFGRKLKCVRKTALSQQPSLSATNPDVVMLDTFGELNKFYSVCDLAIIGNSFGPEHGGHSPLEPASFGKPIIVGPNMHNFEPIVRLLKKADGVIQIEDEADLAYVMRELLANRTLAQGYGQRAYDLVQKNRGALKKTIQELTQIFSPEKTKSEELPLNTSTPTVSPLLKDITELSLLIDFLIDAAFDLTLPENQTLILQKLILLNSNLRRASTLDHLNTNTFLTRAA